MVDLNIKRLTIGKAILLRYDSLRVCLERTTGSQNDLRNLIWSLRDITLTKLYNEIFTEI